MPIIDNQYFIDEIYIPKAQPSITADLLDEESSILNFIYAYERDCLLKTLGRKLFKSFYKQLDSDQENGLIVGAEQKWDDLLNGAVYTAKNGEEKEWRGIRYKNSPLDDAVYDKSFIADYVYFFFQKNDDSHSSRVGDVKPNAKNAEVISKEPKVMNAWNTFIDLAQGRECMPKVFSIDGLVGVDYYGDGEEVSMYEFIRDKNELDNTTYPDFSPRYFKRMNHFGI